MSLILATCATIAAALLSAQPGDVVRLSGQCAVINLPSRDHAEPVEIDATGATVQAVVARGTAGWIWRSGTFFTPASMWRGFLVDNSRRITVTGATFAAGLTAVLVTRQSSGIALRGLTIRNMGADGIDVADSSDVLIAGNDIADFTTVGDYHADGVQVWGASSRVTVTGNRIRGKAQGITTFGPVGVTRMTVSHNDVRVASWWGVNVVAASAANVFGNDVQSLPGFTGAARLWVASDARRCENVVATVRDEQC